MKNQRELLFIFLSLFFFPFHVLASGNVSITDVKIDGISDNKLVDQSISYDGMELYVNTRFTEINDYVKYKVTIENADDKDYELSDLKMDNNSDYIGYEVLFDDGTNIVKANSKKNILVSISYDREIDSATMIDNRFTETSNINLELVDKKIQTPFDNPKTGLYWVIGVFVLTILLFIIGLMVYNKKIKVLSFLLMFLVASSPFFVFATDKLDFVVNSWVEILNVEDEIGIVTDEFCIIHSKDNLVPEYHIFVPGMTIAEWENSDYKDIDILWGSFIDVDGNVLNLSEVGDILLNSFRGCYYNGTIVEEKPEPDLEPDSNPDSSVVDNPNSDTNTTTTPSSNNNTSGGGYRPRGCLATESEIDVYDKKKKKRIRKKLSELNYDDLVLAWDFDKGEYVWVDAFWIMKSSVSQGYVLLEFSDGSILKVIGDHRIYNDDCKMFTSCISEKESPIGMNTINSKGEIVKLVSRRFINENIEYSNVITNGHINIFVNGILTSHGINNRYEIRDMKYIPVEREHFELCDFDGFEDYFDSLCLKEVDINYEGNRESTKKKLLEYIKFLIDNKK